MNLNKLIIFLLLLIVSILLPSRVLADQYGTVEVSKNIDINKLVKKPGTSDWYDNLFASDFRFSPTQQVEFKITVQNTGNTYIDSIRFRDYLPNYVSYVSGDTDVTFSLDVNQSRDFYVTGRVVNAGDLPNNSGLYGVVNTAEATFGNQTDRDTAQIYIEKQAQVAPAKVIPEAGPAENMAILLGSLVLGMTGVVLVRIKK